MGTVELMKTVTFAATLNRSELEQVLLRWLDQKEPSAAKRYIAKVTFNQNDDGEVTGAMIDATAMAD